jgi:hypothetical protein
VISAGVMGDAVADVLALMTATLDDDNEGANAVIAAQENGLPLTLAAVGLLLAAVCEQGDPREWIAETRRRGALSA